MNYPGYIGNGAYCWPNATAMMLSAGGENIAPSLIEVLGAVGLGAYVLPNSNVAFLSNYSGLPDQGISAALKILGFDWEEAAQEQSGPAPFETLQKLLVESPVILGPLDMGYLDYQPGHESDYGIDHYVLAYAMDGDSIRVHDPAGFPNALITKDQLRSAWKAKNIGYKRGYYRYWAKPKRITIPGDEEVYHKAINRYREVYRDGEKYRREKGRIIDVEAIRYMSDKARSRSFTQGEIGTLTGFVFPLGARRANDYAAFFKNRDSKLTNLKAAYADILGYCQLNTVNQKWNDLADNLEKLARVETRFKQHFT